MGRIWESSEPELLTKVDFEKDPETQGDLIYLIQESPEYGRHSIALTLVQVAELMQAASKYLDSPDREEPEFVEVWDSTNAQGIKTVLVGKYIESSARPSLYLTQTEQQSAVIGLTLHAFAEVLSAIGRHLEANG
jgi:hypothetical protein